VIFLVVGIVKSIQIIRIFIKFISQPLKSIFALLIFRLGYIKIKEIENNTQTHVSTMFQSSDIQCCRKNICSKRSPEHLESCISCIFRQGRTSHDRRTDIGMGCLFCKNIGFIENISARFYFNLKRHQYRLLESFQASKLPLLQI